MPFRRIFYIYIVCVLVMVVHLNNGAPLFAQAVNDSGMVFTLTDEKDKIPDPPADNEVFGEFRISLDSQLLMPKVEQPVAERLKLPEAYSQPFTGEFILRNDPVETGDINENLSPVRIHALHEIEGLSPKRRNLDATLTLTAEYLRNYNDSGKISVGRRFGRLSIYGEFQKDTVSKINLDSGYPFAADDGRSFFYGNKVPSAVRKNVSPTGAVSDSGQSLEDPAKHGVSALGLKDYYIEAVYWFLPRLQGKVSYKRSEIETLTPQENLQVEGTIKAGKDMLIKAGYRNETQTREQQEIHRPQNDEKIWTEFILKF